MAIRNWFYLTKNMLGLTRSTISNPSDTYLNILDGSSPSTGNIITVNDFVATLPPGPTGAQGVAGPTGPAGVPGPVGPAGLTWRSTWVSGTSYILNDAVGYNGASYYCILATSGTTNPASNTTNWALLASQGAIGATGATGLQGPTGATGPSGAVPNLEYNVPSKSVWNNGQGNIDTNTSFGFAALGDNTTGDKNTAFGQFSLGTNIDGQRNTAVGTSALQTNQSGSFNTAVGSEALGVNSGGNHNVALGAGALGANQLGESNVAIGSSAMYSNGSGQNNVAVGFETLGSNASGSNNVVVGYNSLSLTSVSLFNTVIGAESCNSGPIGVGNTVVGYGAQAGAFGGSVVLGVDAAATGSNQFVIGSTAYNAGAVTTETTVSSSKTWTVIINGVARKVLLA
jgi:hypothetical protein